MDSDCCIFCAIIKKDIPAKIVFEDNKVLAFEDIKPQSPVHVVIIPKTHIAKMSDVKEGDRALLQRLMLTANAIAKERKILESGYRVVINCGPDAGQVVLHLHLHLLGGRSMAWPPG